jgi:hypothetical protein
VLVMDTPLRDEQGQLSMWNIEQRTVFTFHSPSIYQSYQSSECPTASHAPEVLHDYAAPKSFEFRSIIRTKGRKRRATRDDHTALPS